MAEIDAVDNHMGRTPAEQRAVQPQLPRHPFIGESHSSECKDCGTLRIHDNHRGYDYDVALTHTPECVPHTPMGCKCPKPTPPGVKPETIAEEASRIVYGDREQAYDDPNQNFRRVARMWTGTLDKKLAPGCEITPRDVALMFIQLKISRESFKPQRDNRVDIIGYALCLDRIVQAEDA